MKRIIQISALAAMMAMVGLTPRASATVLTPGTSAFFPASTSGPAVTDVLLATLVDTMTSASGSFSGTLISEVYRNSAGLLDFYYQLINNNTSIDPMDRFTTTGWTNFTTDLSYVTSAFGGLFVTPGAGQNPNFVTRDTPDVLGFNFLGLPTVVKPGSASAILVVKSNATNYIQGIANVIDGSVAVVDDLAPTATPEPASVLFLGTVLIGVTFILRRRFVS